MHKVLIVDDELTCKSSLGKEMLMVGEKRGIDFCFVANPEDALLILGKTFGKQIDMILLDGLFGKGQMHGLMAMKKIREILPDIKIVMISADGDINQSGVDRGANGGVLKKNLPNDLEDDEGMINILLNKESSNENIMLRHDMHRIMNEFLSLDINFQVLEAKKGSPQELKMLIEDIFDDSKVYFEKASDKLEKIKIEVKSKKWGYISGAGYTLEDILFADQVGVFFEKMAEKSELKKIVLKYDWGLKGVKNFHDWYCLLCQVLRQED